MEIEIVINKLNRIEQMLAGQKEILTLQDFCNLTGFSKSHTYKLTAGRKVPFYSPGGKTIFFKRDEVLQWIASNPVKTLDSIEQEANKFVNEN